MISQFPVSLFYPLISHPRSPSPPGVTHSLMILKLESSASSPVATSLEVSMPHQPATFSLPERWFSKSKLVVRSFQAGWPVLFMELHHYIIIRLQIVIVPFALCICMCNGEDAFRKHCHSLCKQLWSWL